MPGVICLMAIIFLVPKVVLSQERETNRLEVEIGVPVVSQFIDKTYDYNYYGNNTIGGVGGLKLGVIYEGKYKLQFTWSNCDEYLFLTTGDKSKSRYEKNFNNIISLSRYMQFGNSKVELGISYLYVYERTTFPENLNRPGLQFSSSDQYIGGYVGYQYLIKNRFGPYVNYHLIPLRFTNGGELAYNHNVNLGLALKF